MDGKNYTPILTFNFYSKTDSSNLFFGTKKVFNVDGLKIYALKNKDSVFVDHHTYFSSQLHDTLINASLESWMQKIYFKLDNTNKDSTLVNYDINNSPCSKGSEINSIIFSGKVVYEDTTISITSTNKIFLRYLPNGKS